MESFKKFAGKLLALIAAVAVGISLNVASAAITPPSSPIVGSSTGSTLSTNLGFVNKPVTADTTSAPVRIGAYSYCTLQFATTAGTSNSTTVKVQASNTQGTWEDFNYNVFTAATTSQAGIYSFNAPVMEYLRLNIDVTNANPLTFTTGLFCR